MYICIYTYMYIYIYTAFGAHGVFARLWFVRAAVERYLYMYMHTYTHTHTHTHIYIYIYVYIHICIYIYTTFGAHGVFARLRFVSAAVERVCGRRAKLKALRLGHQRADALLALCGAAWRARRWRRRWRRRWYWPRVAIPVNKKRRGGSDLAAFSIVISNMV